MLAALEARAPEVLNVAGGDSPPAAPGAGPDLNPTAVQDSQLAYAVYAGMLHTLPACARQWFVMLSDRGKSGAVEAFTAQAVSGPLLAREFEALEGLRSTSSGKFTVRCNAPARQAWAGGWCLGGGWWPGVPVGSSHGVSSPWLVYWRNGVPLPLPHRLLPFYLIQ